MNKALLLLFFLCTLLLTAQTNRFVYEFEYRHSISVPTLDSTKIVVDVFEGQVKNYPKGFLVDKKYYPYPLTVMAQVIDRKIGDSENSTTFKEGEFSYKVHTDDIIKWEIRPDLKRIANMPVQKAIAEFGGRKWTAWFNPEIPIPEGPYKFNGLPGLVVEVSDADENYRYSLKEIKKINDPVDYSFLKTYFGTKLLEINWSKFNKVLSYRYHDPWLLNGRDPLAGVVALEIDGKQIKSRSDFDEAMRGRSKAYKDVFDSFLEKGLVDIK